MQKRIGFAWLATILSHLSSVTRHFKVGLIIFNQ